MGLLNNCLKEYTIQLNKGQIQKAYKGIMTFMSDLRAYLENKYADYTASALYVGYMDMTYFAFTPSALKNDKLKIAIVFLHEECKFELWLAGNNRKVQADYIKMFSCRNTNGYALSQINPGVDSILVSLIEEHPDFDDTDKLKKQIEMKVIEFTKNISAMLKQLNPYE